MSAAAPNGGAGPGGPPGAGTERGYATAMDAALKLLTGRPVGMTEMGRILARRGFSCGDIEAVQERLGDLGLVDDLAIAREAVKDAQRKSGWAPVALAERLSQRGIPAAAIDQALSEGAEPEEAAALRVARQKARSYAGVGDRSVAMRRLVALVARRGFPPSVALRAGRQALDEVLGEGSSAQVPPQPFPEGD